jgi:hypothetical protein
MILGGAMVTRGSAPRRVQVGGETPREEWPFSIDVKGGEIVTLI